MRLYLLYLASNLKLPRKTAIRQTSRPVFACINYKHCLKWLIVYWTVSNQKTLKNRNQSRFLLFKRVKMAILMVLCCF